MLCEMAKGSARDKLSLSGDTDLLSRPTQSRAAMATQDTFADIEVRQSTPRMFKGF